MSRSKRVATSIGLKAASGNGVIISRMSTDIASGKEGVAVSVGVEVIVAVLVMVGVCVIVGEVVMLGVGVIVAVGVREGVGGTMV